MNHYPSSNSNGFESAGTTLRQSFRDLVVSRQKLHRAERLELLRLQHQQGNQSLAFSSRPFVLCGLPIRCPPHGQLLYERRNGQFLLQVTGHPDFGLPFGQDRIVPIFLATLAVRQRSQTIRFKTAAEMLDTFGMHKGGKEYRRLVAAFERVFGATIFFGTSSQAATAKVIHRSRFNFFREAQIWYSRDATVGIPSERAENIIVLSDEFFQEVMAHPIPTDLEAVKFLAPAPAVMDLFMWLSYRCFTAKGRQSIPLFGEWGLMRQLGTADYSRPRRFRAMLQQWLRTIRTIWPDCPAQVSSDGRSLHVDNAAVVSPSRLPGPTVNAGYSVASTRR